MELKKSNKLPEKRIGYFRKLLKVRIAEFEKSEVVAATNLLL